MRVDKVSICLSPDGPGVEVLARYTWLSVTATAQLLGMTPANLVRKVKAGSIPLQAVTDPEQPGWLKVRAWEVAEYLASREPRWPTVEEFAAEPSLSLAEVKGAAGDTNPAGPGDPATGAYLQVRDTATLADFAIMSGISQDAMRRRAQRGKVELVDAPTAAGSIRRHRAVPSKYAAEAMNVATTPME